MSSKSSESSNSEIVHTFDVNNSYTTLFEISEKYAEAVYCFIKYNGNEEVIKQLKKDLSSIEWMLEEDQSAFELDVDHLVSATTASEIIKLDINCNLRNRMFVGKLESVPFGFKKHDDNERKMKKVNRLLSGTQIECYIDKEYIDLESYKKMKELSEESSSEEEKKVKEKRPYQNNATKTARVMGRLPKAVDKEDMIKQIKKAQREKGMEK